LYRSRWLGGALTGTIAQSGASQACCAECVQPYAGSCFAARLKVLEDKEEIHAVMMEYGRTLDNRDFARLRRAFFPGC
jgi:hypothetical protein